jgi:hypothetical protein
MVDKTLKKRRGAVFWPPLADLSDRRRHRLMRGGREYLAARLGRPVKVPVQKTAKLNSPVFNASALGLVSLIFDSHRAAGRG